jgi:hypothetical protein
MFDLIEGVAANALHPLPLQARSSIRDDKPGGGRPLARLAAAFRVGDPPSPARGEKDTVSAATDRRITQSGSAIA